MNQIRQIVFSALIIQISLMACSVKAQKNNQLENMINESLLQILNEKETYYLERFENKKSLTKDFYIFEEHFPRNFEFSEEIRSIGIKFISINNLSNEQKKKGVFGISFTGVSLNDNLLKLTFISQGAKMRDNTLEVGYSEGFEFYYKYSCELKKWIFSSSNLPNELPQDR